MSSEGVLLPRIFGARFVGFWNKERLALITDLAAFAVIAVALALQFATMRDRSFSSDEALHFSLVNVPGVVEAVRRGMTNAHPPLFFLLLHFWERVGRSEFVLRLLPAILGAACLWFIYQWGRRMFGRTAGFVTLVLMGFSPIWMPLSAELRHYSLLLALSAAALWQLDEAINTLSMRKMLVFSVLLYLAILSHYSAFFVAAALGLYGSLRLRETRAPRTPVHAWVGAQAGVVCLYTVLYFMHVRGLRGSAMEAGAIDGWLRDAYFHPSQETAIAFLRRQTWQTFLFFFGSRSAAGIGLLLALIGVAFLAAKKRVAAILVVAPWLLGAAAGLVNLYPFGGSRHSVYLLPFVLTSIGIAISEVAGKKVWAALVASALLVWLYGSKLAWAPECQHVSETNAAIEQLKSAAPAGSLLFADFRTGLLLSYYLGRDLPSSERPVPGNLWEGSAGDYCIVRSAVWSPVPQAYAKEVERFLHLYRIPHEQRFWAIRSGREFDVTRALERLGSGVILPVSHTPALSIAEVWLAEAPGPESHQ